MSDTASADNALVVEMDFSVKTYDIDYAGHVSNIVYLRWLEDMRYKVFAEHFSFRQCLEDGFMAVLSSTHIEYRKPVRLFEPVKGIMRVRQRSRASLDIEAEISAGGTVRAESRQVIVFVDTRTMRPRRLPPAIANRFRNGSSS